MSRPARVTVCPAFFVPQTTAAQPMICLLKVGSYCVDFDAGKGVLQLGSQNGSLISEITNVESEFKQVLVIISHR